MNAINRAFLFSFFSSLFFSTVCAQNNFNWKKVNVLVYTKNGKGYVHQNIAAATTAIQSLGGQYGFTVKVSDNPAEFTEANLKNYQVLIFNNTNNDVFDTDDVRGRSVPIKDHTLRKLLIHILTEVMSLHN